MTLSLSKLTVFTGIVECSMTVIKWNCNLQVFQAPSTRFLTVLEFQYNHTLSHLPQTSSNSEREASGKYGKQLNFTAREAGRIRLFPFALYPITHCSSPSQARSLTITLSNTTARRQTTTLTMVRPLFSLVDSTKIIGQIMIS